MRLPPGPRLPKLAQTALFLSRPVEFLDACHRRYGDCFTVNTYLIGREIEIVHPDLVRQVFTGDPDVLRAGEANDILRPLLGSRSVLLLDGPEHVRQRKLLMPPFHGERVMAWARTMQEVTLRVVDTWRPGAAFALHPHMQRITLEVILRTVFGVDEGSHLDDLRDALTRVLDRQSRPIDSLFTLPPLRRSFLGLSPWDGFLRDREDADALIYRQIARRRAERDGNGVPRADVLAMLLDARDEDGEPMTDVELRDELVTLLVAGHETTATMLCWAVDFLLGDERVLAKVRRELADAGGEGDLDPATVVKLPYLDAVIKEVLRLRPVVPAVGRRLKEPIALGRFEIPAGELVVPVSFLTHRLASVYPEPEAFKPERFLDKKPDPYAWFPFGGGSRRCLGMTFSLHELKVVLASVLTSVRLRKRHPGPATVKLRGFTLVPKGGVEVELEGRVARERMKVSGGQTLGAGAE
ncbi:MAG TPA: cytochrome P450 [Polyangiaceae bacterium]